MVADNLHNQAAPVLKKVYGDYIFPLRATMIEQKYN